MMKTNWTVFEGRPNTGTTAKAIRVTLGYGRTFYLNHAAYEAIGRPAGSGRAVI
jgi:hypothetical protein